MSDEFKTITAGDWTQTFAENRPRENKVAAQIKMAMCERDLSPDSYHCRFGSGNWRTGPCVHCPHSSPNGKAIEPRP